MIKIRPKPNERIEKTLKRFKRLCENEGITRDYRRHEYYESPGVAKRHKRIQAQKRREKEESMQASQKNFRRDDDVNSY